MICEILCYIFAYFYQKRNYVILFKERPFPFNTPLNTFRKLKINISTIVFCKCVWVRRGWGCEINHRMIHHKFIEFSA